jgi:hypothetical protein
MLVVSGLVAGMLTGIVSGVILKNYKGADLG